MQTITNLLSYVGYFFAGVAALIGLVWFGLGVWNLIKIYYDVWKARREYKNEKL